MKRIRVTCFAITIIFFSSFAFSQRVLQIETIGKSA